MSAARARHERAALGLAPCPCGAPGDRRSRRCRGARPARARAAPDSFFAISPNPCSCQASTATMRWRAKLSTRRPEPRSSKPSSSSAADERPQARLLLAHRHGADHGAEYQPRRRLVLVGVLRPGEARPAHEPAIDPHRVGPIEGDRLLRRRVHGERVGERGQAGIESAPRRPQRLLRFQHHRELHEIEAADIDQRSGPLLGRHRGGVGKGVTDLAQVTSRNGGGRSSAGFDDVRRRLRCSSGISVHGSRMLFVIIITCYMTGFARAQPSLSSAADLKFLERLPQTRVGTSNRKAALES